MSRGTGAIVMQRLKREQEARDDMEPIQTNFNPNQPASRFENQYFWPDKENQIRKNALR